MVCLDPPEVAYTVSSTVDTNQDGLELLTYQEEVIYSCVSGYEPTGGGDNRRMCMHDGGFNGTDLICKLECKYTLTFEKEFELVRDGVSQRLGSRR